MEQINRSGDSTEEKQFNIRLDKDEVEALNLLVKHTRGSVNSTIAWAIVRIAEMVHRAPGLWLAVEKEDR